MRRLCLSCYLYNIRSHSPNVRLPITTWPLQVNNQLLLTCRHAVASVQCLTRQGRFHCGNVRSFSRPGIARCRLPAAEVANRHIPHRTGMLQTTALTTTQSVNGTICSQFYCILTGGFKGRNSGHVPIFLGYEMFMRKIIAERTAVKILLK